MSMSVERIASPQSEQESIVTVMHDEFQAVRDFWLQFVAAPDYALTTGFPQALRAMEREADVITGDELSPVDAYCVLIDITGYLANPELRPLGVECLPYDPVAAFGETGVAAIVEYGIALDQTA